MRFKPCPFCGGKALDVMTKEFYSELMDENGRACVSMRCKACALDMYEHTDGVTYEEKLDLLKAKWNRRTK